MGQSIRDVDIKIRLLSNSLAENLKWIYDVHSIFTQGHDYMLPQPPPPPFLETMIPIKTRAYTLAKKQPSAIEIIY